MVNPSEKSLDELLQSISDCQICAESALAKPLPHEPRPVVVASTKARIAICGQAPGTRVHQSGIPFQDASGNRLREWLGVDELQFYNRDNFAILPMGFCFPGLDNKGGDLPPRKECARAWREPLMALMPQLEVLLLVGLYAQNWHLGKRAKKNLTETVGAWREFSDEKQGRKIIPLPHPSWRNNGWLKKHGWFEAELLPSLRASVKALL